MKNEKADEEQESVTVTSVTKFLTKIIASSYSALSS